jgi:hypothetical protein
VTFVDADLDPFTEAVGRVVIAGKRLDAAIGVLTAYALDDRSGRVMPGATESLLRWWGDYVDHVEEYATRQRHQAIRATAVELGRWRADTINALGRIAGAGIETNRDSTGDKRQAAMSTHAVQDLRDLAAAITAHVDVVLDLADEVRDSGGLRHAARDRPRSVAPRGRGGADRG